MEKVVCRASAKVPIVKMWDPELQLACDLNVNNPIALENTRMIKTYVQIDDRVRPLAKIIKYWTKRRILNDAGEHSVSWRVTFADSASLWWYHQLIYMDLHDTRLSAESHAADIAFIAITARRLSHNLASRRCFALC